MNKQPTLRLRSVQALRLRSVQALRLRSVQATNNNYQFSSNRLIDN